MWSSIDRARRRLDRASAGSKTAAPAEETASEPEVESPSAPPMREDVVIVLGPAELDTLRVALQQALGNAVERPDTPARIEHALSLVLAGRDDPGRPRVLRRPAGVSTPEAWEIHLEGVDHATGTAVRSAGRTGRFHA